MSEDESYAPFFDALGQPQAEMPMELFRELAEAFGLELGLKDDAVGKLMFLIELGYLARKSIEQDKSR
jgi:hypothetical protein